MVVAMPDIAAGIMAVTRIIFIQSLPLQNLFLHYLFGTMMSMRQKVIIFFRIVLILILVYISVLSASGKEPGFLSALNLTFHEAGHPIFAIFGNDIGFLGGALGQLIIPAIFSIYFLIYRNTYASLIMLWWFGDNLINISIYISDASTQTLPLIGGEHDWAYLLGKYHLLNSDAAIGGTVYDLGLSVMSIAIIFGAIAAIPASKEYINRVFHRLSRTNMRR